VGSDLKPFDRRRTPSGGPPVGLLRLAARPRRPSWRGGYAMPTQHDTTPSAAAGPNRQTRRRIYSQAFCRRPVRLTSSVTDDGELLDNPVTLLTACGNRRRAVCPYCSHLYAGDAWHVAASGYRPRTAYLWVTLTSPSFGRVHSNPAPPALCACGELHHEHADILGTPIDPEKYDYAGAVAWNQQAGPLWQASVYAIRLELRRRRADALGVRPGQLPVPPLDYMRCFEHQARGQLHVHALIRGWPIDPATLRDLLIPSSGKSNPRRGTVHSVASGPEPVSSHGCKWGTRFDIQAIPPGDNKAVKDRMSYLAKYATKAAADDVRMAQGQRKDHYERMTAATTTLLTGSGSSPAGSTPANSRADILCAHGVAPSLCRPCRVRIGNLGHGGHVLSKSRNWGTTFGKLRARRTAWAVDNRPPLHDTVSMTGWTWIGSGYAADEWPLAGLAAMWAANRTRPPSRGP